MNDSTLEPYSNSRPGYQLMFQRDGWQIGRLNFTPEFEPRNITRLKRHRRNARTLVQFQGAPILVTAYPMPNGFQFETHRIQPGLTCRIPMDTWYAIAMSPGDVVLILERAHPDASVEYYEFTSADQESWNHAVSCVRQGENFCGPPLPAGRERRMAV